MRFAILVTLVVLPIAASAQTVPTMDPYEPALRRCFHQLMGNSHASLTEAEQLLANPALPPVPHVRASVCRAEALATLGRSEEAGSQAEAVVALLDRYTLPDMERMQGLFVVGNVLQRTNHNRRALELFERGHALAVASNSEKAQIAALTNLGTVHAIGMNDPAAAEPYFRKAAEISEEHGGPALSDIMMLYNYGYTLLRLKRYDEAMVLFDKVLTLSSQLPDLELNLHRTNSNRGEIMRQTGKVEAGRELLEASAAAQHSLPDPQGEAVTLLRLASLQLDAGQAAEALPLAERALNLAEQGRFPAETLDSLALLEEIHEALGQPERALAFAKRAHALELENIRQHNLEWVGQAQSRLQAVVGNEDAAWGDRLIRANLLRNLSLAGLALVLLLAMFLVLRLRRRHRTLKQEISIDPVTTLSSERFARQRIAAQPLRAGTQSALLLVGIDNLDAVNRDHGRAAGDALLRAVAARVRSNCREDDLLARWTGAELLVLRPDTSEAAAQAFAEHLCGSTNLAPVALPEAMNIQPIVSVSVVPYPLFPDEEAPRFEVSLEIAERLLRLSRSQGSGHWVALWGLPAGRGTSLSHLRDSLQQAHTQGLVSLGSSRSLDWNENREVEQTLAPH